MQKEQFSMFMLNFESSQGRQRCYADHVFIQIYFRMHHFVVEFSKFYLSQAARGN